MLYEWPSSILGGWYYVHVEGDESIKGTLLENGDCGTMGVIQGHSVSPLTLYQLCPYNLYGQSMAVVM